MVSCWIGPTDMSFAPKKMQRAGGVSREQAQGEGGAKG